MKKKNLVRKATCLAMLATMTLSYTQVNAFAYGEYQSASTAAQTDGSSEFQSWRDNIWHTEGNYDNSAKIALTPGKTEKDLNFSWYSKEKGTPAVRVWKDGNKSNAVIVTGEAKDITAENWQGNIYTAKNQISVNDYFEYGNTYNYEYTDNYTGDASTKWSDTYKYNTTKSEEFSVILTGDPQIGASGSSDDKTATDSSVSRDTYNWNKTIETAMKVCPDAAFLLSAGDQIDTSGTSDNNLKTRESEYAGYLYPVVFRNLPIASTIGNHDTAVSDYSAHFNNPNSEKKLGSTNAGSDYYFKYGKVLIISLNSNNRNQAEHRALMQEAIDNNSDALWKVVIFHSDIYGSGQPHADTDAATNRVIFAPLMDEFDIDICLTGHDHTYSRSYQVLDGNVIDYDISSGSVTNPEGTLYITTGSGSGSKYYNLLNYTPYYIAERTNALLPSFSTIDFTNNSLTIKTYDYDGNKYADDFTINKTSDDISTDDLLSQAEDILTNNTSKYTEDSIAKLKAALEKLKALKESYTTEKDAFIDEITAKYGKEDDRVKGYGSVVNAEDKDIVNEMPVNRFKQGISTLLDKTIYLQISNGVEIENANLPIVKAESVEASKAELINAIKSLEEIKNDDKSDDNNNGNDNNGGINNDNNSNSNNKESIKADNKNASIKSNDNNTVKSADTNIKAPKTGDKLDSIICVAGMSILSIAAAMLSLNRKKEEDCEE